MLEDVHASVEESEVSNLGSLNELHCSGLYFGEDDPDTNGLYFGFVQ